ncbi:hypothetical protein GCM10010271_72830 [Streptomyces kurssanovii]|nr:hypothetical protein GCM10010271_72830 [Streptomyces kurssanovii]
MIHLAILTETRIAPAIGLSNAVTESWDTAVPSFDIDIRASADHQLPPEPVDKRCS